MSEILIKVDRVSKKFCRDLKRGLWYGVKDIGNEILGGSKDHSELRHKEFWAVQDVSFEVKRGECLGLIGHNGAGKSTLLKMLNGLIKPDTGRIEMRGKVGALIELGAGFNPILTGRENIYMNASVLGFARDEINKKFDSIVAFSELEKFIDTPVQYYSSGMKVRLGFAVASHMEPDILIIDEVLAVGDMGFVLKCFQKIDDLLDKVAVIFVSHNMPQVYRVSSQLILMEKGKSIYNGENISEGIDLYYSKFNFVPSYQKNDRVEILGVKINNIECFKVSKPIQVKRLENLSFELHLRIDKQYTNPELFLVFYDKELRGVAEYFQEEGSEVKNLSGVITISIVLPNINFSKGVYSITVGLKSNRRGEVLLRAQSVAYFQVISDMNVWTAFQLSGKFNQINVDE